MKTTVTATTHKSAKAFLLITLILLSTNLFASVGKVPEVHRVDADKKEQNWNLIRQKNGITLFQRWVDTGNGWSCKESYLTFISNAPIQTVLDIVSTDAYSKEWISSVEHATTVSRSSPDTWYSHLIFETPWPLKKQDVVLENTIDHDPAGKSVSIQMISAAHILDPKNGVTRLTAIQVRWKITFVSMRQTRIQFFIFNAEKSKFPHWITDPIVQNSLISTMQNLDELIRKIEDCNSAQEHQYRSKKPE